MSMAKRLVLVITGLFLLVFVGIFTISISNTRHYLQQQLKISAQETATLLGKSIADSLLANDREKLKTIVDAVYDRGYNSLIKIRAVGGETLINREQDKVFIKNVPVWFVRFIQLQSPIGQQDIIDNSFRQVGQVTVTAHPGLAYAELWNNFKGHSSWLTFVALLAFISVYLIVRLLTRPLADLEHQANEIANGNFTTRTTLPTTPELHRVATTMNKMSGKVAQMLTSQTELTERMRTRAYQDTLTGLHNRRYFAEQMDHLIKTPEEFVSGALMLVEVNEFKAYNQKLGYVKADELLKKVAEIISQHYLKIDRVCLARVSGASFAVLAPNIAFDEAKSLAKKLHDVFEGLHNKGKIDDIATTHVGIAFYDGHQDSTQLLSMADMALRAAQIKGPNQWNIYDEQNVSQEKARGASAWKRVIESMLNSRSIALHYQPVRSIDTNNIMHYEVLARMPDRDGNLVTAGVFLPMAQRHGLAVGVDIVVIEKLLETMGDENQVQYAVNLSNASIQDAAFTEWLIGQLKRYPHRAQSIVFEMREHSVSAHLSTIKETLLQLRTLGCAFSIDHFGTGSPDFSYLLNTKIDYLKIDGSYIHNIDRNEDHRFFLKSITEIAHGLDIKVIAEYVETENEWNALKGLKLDGAQGHFLGKPIPNIIPEGIAQETVLQSQSIG